MNSHSRMPCAPLRPTSLALSIFAVIYCTSGHAESYFNPAFLSDDAGSVADLARYAQGNRQPAGVYQVDIWRNGELATTRDIRFDEADPSSASAPPAKSGGLVPCLDSALLKLLGLNFKAFPELAKYKDGQCIPLEQEILGASAELDFSKLRLDISLPQASMLGTARGYIPPEQWDEGISAALFNYNLSGSQGDRDSSQYLNLQSGLNLGPWRLRSNGSLSQSEYNGQSSGGWQNISTYAQRSVIPLKSELVVGDGNTNSDVFDSIGFRGARLWSNDQMYPDSMRGYAPTVRGIARSNAKVTVAQNGYVIYQTYVTPGEFNIEDMYATSSSGDLEVTVEETDGSKTKYSIPYSSVPLLQREGRLKYDFTVGNFRSGSSGQEAPTFVQGTLIAGLQGGYTLYGGTQMSTDYKALSFGAGKNLGDWGAISLDLTGAWSHLPDSTDKTGQSLRFLYAKTLNDYGTTFQLLGYRYSTEGFYTLSDTAWKSMSRYDYSESDPSELVSYHDLNHNKKGRFQGSISQTLNDYGALYASGSEQTYWGESQSDVWYQFGYTNHWRGISYSLAWSWSQSVGYNEADRAITFNLSIPFSAFGGSSSSSRSGLLDNAYATLNTVRNSNGNNAVQAGVAGTLLQTRNLNYGISQGNSDYGGHSGSANLDWQGAYGKLGLAYSYDDQQSRYSWQAAGGAVVHEDGITFGQPLGDTNVLVKAPGASNVQVENQIGVKTDWRGYTVLPYATAFRANRVALDTNSMDDHTDIINNVSNVVPTQGALVRASFDAHVGVRAIVTLTRGNKALPFGSSVQEAGSGVSGIVGDEGQVYLAGLPLQGELQIRWGDGDSEQCVAKYSLPEDSLKEAVTIAAATCE